MGRRIALLGKKTLLLYSNIHYIADTKLHWLYFKDNILLMRFYIMEQN